MTVGTTRQHLEKEQRIEQLFLEALSRHGIYYMTIASVLVLLWLYVDYSTEYARFEYYAALRLCFAIPSLIAVVFYRKDCIQRNVHKVLFGCYLLLVTTLGLMVAVSDNLLLYSMGYSTVFLGTSVFLVWKLRFITAGIPLAIAIMFLHWPYLEANHSYTQLIVVGAYMMNVFCISVLFTFVIYRSFAKQFKLIWENEQYELRLAKQVEELAGANDALRVADATKNKFFSIIAHDLRGPVGSLSVLFNEVISVGADLDGPMLKAARSTTKNLHNLLEELLSWARSQQGSIEVKPKNFAVSEPVDECITLLSGNAEQKRVRILNTVSGTLFAYADPDLVTTVIRNLMSNAVKYSSSGDTITIAAQTKGEFLEVSVEDTGVGMGHDVMERLFRIDEKVESSLGTSDEPGTGLGLILCREFVEKNDGEIGVESHLGRGSRFWFTLPVADTEAYVDKESAAKVEERLGNLNVLLVEDNVLHAKTSSLVLKELGVRYASAGDGVEAVEKAEEAEFDVVLMDIDMPRLNGIEASRRLENVGGKRPWIIALSCYSKGELENARGSFSFDGYLNKPLSRNALIDALKQLLN